jgi:hypothetical protein
MSIDKFHFVAKGKNPSDIAYGLNPDESSACCTRARSGQTA